MFICVPGPPLHLPPRHISGCCPVRRPPGRWGAAWPDVPYPSSSSTSQTAAPTLQHKSDASRWGHWLIERTHEGLSEHQWVSIKGFRDHQLFYVSAQTERTNLPIRGSVTNPILTHSRRENWKRLIYWHTEPSHSHRYIRCDSVRYLSWSGPSMMLHWGPVLSKTSPCPKTQQWHHFALVSSYMFASSFESISMHLLNHLLSPADHMLPRSHDMHVSYANSDM